MNVLDKSKMEELYDYRHRLLGRMESILDDFRITAAAASPEDWKRAQSKDQNHPHWVLAHLRNIEVQALAPRLKKILTEDDPQLVLFDDERWMETHYRPDEPVETIINDYESIRREELKWLKEMSVQAWSRTCRHPWFGIRTLQWWVERILAYAEEHLEEINECLFDDDIPDNQIDKDFSQEE